MVRIAVASGPGISVAPVALVCPTRGRPENAERLLREWARTGACSALIFCVDEDDPAVPAYWELASRPAAYPAMVTWLTGPRQGLCKWTDDVARMFRGQYQALMSIGDDHVPETDRFDQKLWDATARTGGGFAYGDDGIIHQASADWPEPHNLPTACLITANVIQALGRVCLPGAQHMFTDPYWLLLAEAAGCRHFLPEVKVTHYHPVASRAAWDRTYAEGAASWPADEQAYETWKRDRLAADAARVKEALG